MFTLLLALLILDGILLMVVILLQAGKGGGLAAMGGGVGTESLIGGRQAATILTKTSWISGGVFLALSLVLSIMSSRQQQPESVLQQQFQQTAPAAPQPVLPGVQPAEPGAQPEGGAPGETVPQEGAAPTGQPEPQEQGQSPG